MKVNCLRLTAFAVAVMLNVGVFANSTAQAKGPAQRHIAPAQQVDVVGCIWKEADYRKANRFFNPAGVGDEYILVDASMAPAVAADTTVATSEAGWNAATGTAGATNTYELNGKNEKDLKSYVGKRVEITGMLKAQEIGTDGRPTGGPSASITADLKLRELEVASVRESSGSVCPMPSNR